MIQNSSVRTEKGGGLQAELYGLRSERGDAVLVGLAGAVLFNLVLAVFGTVAVARVGDPAAVRLSSMAGDEVPQTVLDVVLNPDEEAVEPSNPERYVEVNPDAPVRDPLAADAFSFQSQQAASPEPTEGPRDEPKVDGTEEMTGKLLPGEMPLVLPDEPSERGPVEPPEVVASEPVPPPEPMVEPEPAPVAASEAPDGLGLPWVQPGVAQEGEPGERPDVRPPPRPQTPVAAQVPQRTAAPLPRPRLPEVLPGLVELREGGTTLVGVTALNAKFNEYGEYLRRMQEAIQLQWYRLAFQNLDALVIPSRVQIRFDLDQEGRVWNLQILSTDSSTTGTLITSDAIRGRSPFGPFSEDMRRTLGEMETLVFTFTYR